MPNICQKQDLGLQCRTSLSLKVLLQETTGNVISQGK